MTPTKAMLVPAKQSLQVQRLIEEERIKEERMQEVLILLQHLFEREKATLKMIINCLYDVALINAKQKVRSRPLKGLLRFFARGAKPLLRPAGLLWVQRACPKLITDWLYSQVSFEKES